MKKILRILTIYFAITSTITFSMFIMEEAIQMCVFGTWPAQDAGAWVLVKQNLEKMEQINNSMDTINKYCGWLQPFAYISYAAYAEATRAYITSVRQKIATIRPQALIDQTITLTFIPANMEIDHAGRTKYRLGALSAYDCSPTKSTIRTRITTTGTIRETVNGQCMLTCD